MQLGGLEEIIFAYKLYGRHFFEAVGRQDGLEVVRGTEIETTVRLVSPINYLVGALFDGERAQA